MRHLSFSGEEILETIRMVRTEQLDIRTITVGISLLERIVMINVYLVVIAFVVWYVFLAGPGPLHCVGGQQC